VCGWWEQREWGMGGMGGGYKALPMLRAWAGLFPCLSNVNFHQRFQEEKED